MLFVSKLQVNSKRNIFLSALFRMTKSGFEVVTRMSRGMMELLGQNQGDHNRSQCFLVCSEGWIK